MREVQVSGMELRWELYRMLIFTLTAAQCQGCEPYWISCPGNISVLEGTDARFEWSHNISGEVDIRWLHKGKTIMDYSGGVTGPSRRRADYTKDAPGSATMILKNVTSGDAGVYETRVVNQREKTHHPSNAFLTIIEGANVVVHYKLDGVRSIWSLDKNGTTITLPNLYKEIHENLSVEVMVPETAPTPASMSVYLEDHGGQPWKGELSCTHTKICRRKLQVQESAHATNADTLNIMIDFNIQNMKVFHLRQMVSLLTEEKTEYKEFPITPPGRKGHISQATIRINNRVVNSGMTLNLSHLTQASVIVTTEEPSNITLRYQDIILDSCTADTICFSIVELKDPQGNITVHVTVSYSDHFYQGTFIILTNPDLHVQKTISKTVVIVISLLIVIVITSAILVFFMRKKIWKHRYLSKKDVGNNECSHSSTLDPERKDDVETVPHSYTTDPLIYEECHFVPEVPSEPHVTVQLQVQPRTLGKSMDRVENQKTQRMAEVKLMAVDKKKQRGKKTRRKEKDNTAHKHQLESDRTLVSEANLPPASPTLTPEITPDTRPLTEWVNLPSPVPENRTMVAVVKPQTATAETEEPKSPFFLGAFRDRSQREQIHPLLFPHGVS